MKKHYLLLLLSFLFCVVTAMTCEDRDYEMIKIPCVVKDVTLHHWDNANEFPKEPMNGKVPKEAYILEICVWAEMIEDGFDSSKDAYNVFHVLSDNIKKISIFTDVALNENLPAGAEVTSCFSEYPKTIGNQQTIDETYKEAILYRRMHKALLTVPQPGEYRFRVVLTLESGETIERVSEPVSLY